MSMRKLKRDIACTIINATLLGWWMRELTAGGPLPISVCVMMIVWLVFVVGWCAATVEIEANSNHAPYGPPESDK